MYSKCVDTRGSPDLRDTYKYFISIFLFYFALFCFYNIITGRQGTYQMGHYVGTIDGRAGMTQILGQSTAVANQRPDINKLDNIVFLLVFLMLLMFISLLVFAIS